MSTTKQKKVPLRRCVGCMESKPKAELVRVAGYEGRAALDPTGKAKGRGVYLCKDADCIAKAFKKKALQRGLQMEISEEDINKIQEELSQL